MNVILKTNIILLITALSITACTSSPTPEPEPVKQLNSAQSQRLHAKQAQDELSKKQRQGRIDRTSHNKLVNYIKL